MFKSAMVALACLCSTAYSAEITGVVEPIPECHFRGSPVKEWPVTKIHVKVGSHVQAGDCLVELDPALLPMQKATADWDAAKSHSQALRAKLAVREGFLRRCQKLLPSGACSKESEEECRESVEMLRRELEQAVAQERSAEVQFKMAKYDFDNYQRINALVSGEVVAVRCCMGMVARAEDRQLVWVEVIDSSHVQIRCQISPGLVQKLKNIMVQKTALAIAGTKCTATVVAIPPVISNGKYEMLLEAGNPHHELVCGQEVRLDLP